jgi:hypothetical protein
VTKLLPAVFAAALLGGAPAYAVDQFAKARADIDSFCSTKSEEPVANCVSEQREGLGRFVVIMSAFEDPGERVAKKCMTSARSGRYVDWVVAKACMQAAAKGLPIGGTLRE